MRTIKTTDGRKHRFPTSTREVKRALIDKGISGNIVKWGGKYDIAVVHDGEKRMIPTGLRSVQDITIDDWVELFEKAHQGQTYLL